MKPTTTPRPKAIPTQEKLGETWRLGRFFPQAMIFRGLGLIKYRKRDCNKPNPTELSATPGWFMWRRAAVATGAWVKSKHDVYLIRGSVGA